MTFLSSTTLVFLLEIHCYWSIWCVCACLYESINISPEASLTWGLERGARTHAQHLQRETKEGVGIFCNVLHVIRVRSWTLLNTESANSTFSMESTTYLNLVIDMARLPMGPTLASVHTKHEQHHPCAEIPSSERCLSRLSLEVKSKPLQRFLLLRGTSHGFH